MRENNMMAVFCLCLPTPFPNRGLRDPKEKPKGKKIANQEFLSLKGTDVRVDHFKAKAAASGAQEVSIAQTQDKLCPGAA